MKTRKNNLGVMIQKARSWEKNFFPQGLIGRKVEITVFRKDQDAAGKKFLQRFTICMTWSKIVNLSLIKLAGRNLAWSLIHLDPPIAITPWSDMNVLFINLQSVKKRKKIPIEIRLRGFTDNINLKGWLEFIDEPQSK